MIRDFEQRSGLVRLAAIATVGFGLVGFVGSRLDRAERAYRHNQYVQTISSATSLSSYNRALIEFTRGQYFASYFPEQDPDHFYQNFAVDPEEDSLSGIVEGWIGLAKPEGVEILSVLARKKKELVK